MTTVRVQGQFDIAGAPGVGNWTIYRKAYFTVAGTVAPPSGTVRTLLQRLLIGAVNSSATQVAFSTTRYRTGGGAFRLQVHELSGGGSLTKVHDSTNTLESYNAPSPTLALPPQVAIAVGYRADLGSGVPRQRGRSRLFLGPITCWSSNVIDNGTNGFRPTTTLVDRIATNFQSNVAALAAQGWVLGVRVMESGGALAPAVECYVDDVWDIQRGRRAWQTYQRRETL